MTLTETSLYLAQRKKTTNLHAITAKTPPDNKQKLTILQIHYCGEQFSCHDLKNNFYY
jgi:hypothetical protein